MQHFKLLTLITLLCVAFSTVTAQNKKHGLGNIQSKTISRHSTVTKEVISMDTVLEAITEPADIKHVEHLEHEKIFTAVEQQPQFPGGQAALMKWLCDNLRYPEIAQQNEIQGRVIVKFVVRKDGSITDVSIAKGVDNDLDREAIRIVKRMPKWTPGKNNGQNVNTYFYLPIIFKLQ